MESTDRETAARLLREMAEYIRFSDGDLELLRGAFPQLEPHLPRMAELFYESIRRNPEANAFLLQTGASIERLQTTLQEWARSLLTFPRDAAYAQSRLAIGERHVRIGLRQKYVLGAMNVVRTFLQERLTDPGGRAASAVHRAIDLDMNLICEAYFLRSLEAKDAERRSAEERLEDFLDRSNVLVVGLDLAGRITLFNRTVEQVTGRRREEVLGKEYAPIFLPERVRASVMETVRRIAAGGALDPMENPIVNREGREHLVRWFPSVTRDAGGRIREVIGIGHDITELAWLQAQAAEREKAAAMGVMAAGVAHEVGNPLNSILAITQALQRRLKDSAVQEDLRLVAEEVARVSRTLREMTRLARPARRSVRNVQVNDVIVSTLDLLRFDPRARRHEIVLQLDPDLPTTAAAPDELSQLFLNLLLNAFDAMADRRGKVFLRSRREGEALRVEIEDTGCGIPDSAIPHLFEPFYSTKEEGKGSGLGLWICRRIAQNHSGRIDVRSAVGSGTAFTVTLPITKVSAPLPARVC